MRPSSAWPLLVGPHADRDAVSGVPRARLGRIHKRSFFEMPVFVTCANGSAHIDARATTGTIMLSELEAAPEVSKKVSEYFE